jgi:hypothetical protein
MFRILFLHFISVLERPAIATKKTNPETFTRPWDSETPVLLELRRESIEIVFANV